MTTRSLPTVAVVIPTRDRPQLVRRAITSVVEQTYAGPIECVVVADQSELPPGLPAGDGANRRVRAIANDRSPGLAGARNSGILASSSDLVAFLDDDDEWLPTKLERQVEVLGSHADVDVVACAVELVLDRRSIVRRIPPVVSAADLRRSRVPALNPCTMLVRRRLLERVGLVDEELPGSYGEDWEWLLRALRETTAVGIDEPLVRIDWTRASWLGGRWQAMAAGLEYIAARHPDLLVDGRGGARLLGQIAFAHAAAGNRRRALAYALRGIGRRAAEPRALLALGVLTGLVDPERVRRSLARGGRGV
jgi:glycosyltransferase involved in cell wall biosynthesis